MTLDLIGYLLGALDETEHQEIQQQIDTDPSLREKLDRLEQQLRPLESYRHCEPPAHLAADTVSYVFDYVDNQAPQPASVISRPARTKKNWSRWDLIITSTLLVGVALLIVPGVANSRYQAELRECQFNLQEIGQGLLGYSMVHNGYYPAVPDNANLGVAGYFPPVLLESGFLDRPDLVYCPSESVPEEWRSGGVPKSSEVMEATGEELKKLQLRMGGSYGFNVGYVIDGKYYRIRNLGRPFFAIAADQPHPVGPDLSSNNHGGRGQNVLFEDGHVQFIVNPAIREHIFQSNRGRVEPGQSINDSVILRSEVRVYPVSE